MKKLIIFVSLFILISLSIFVFDNYFQKPKSKTVETQTEIQNNLKQEIQISPSNSINNPKATTSTKQESKNSDLILYEDKDRGFSIMHPFDLIPENMQSGELAFILWGPTQAEDTEFFDGINISFQSIPSDGLNLKDRVEEEREMLIDIYGQDVSNIDPIIIDNKNGYIFNDHMAQYIYLPQENDKYLYIVNMTADPSNLGYKDTVYKMIESIKVLN